MRVAINGFGRIGKLVFRAFLERKIKGVSIVAINELGSLESSHHLLEYDSTHGKLETKIKRSKKGLNFNPLIFIKFNLEFSAILIKFSGWTNFCQS